MADPGLLTSLIMGPSSLASVPTTPWQLEFDGSQYSRSDLGHCSTQTFPLSPHLPGSLIYCPSSTPLLGGGRAHPQAAIVHPAQEVTLRLSISSRPDIRPRMDEYPEDNEAINQGQWVYEAQGPANIHSSSAILSDGCLPDPQADFLLSLHGTSVPSTV